MKAFVTTLLLCFIFVLFQGNYAVARNYHKHLRVHHASAHFHSLKSKAKFKKKQRVRVSTTSITPHIEPDICLFFCRAQELSSPRVASYGAPSPWKRMERKDAVTYRGNVIVGPRPSAWCGWWLQTYTGVTSAATHLNLNRAIEWAQVGRAISPQIGAIVVWRHHVGKITGVAANGRYLVMSGNSGGHRGARTVTERPRSLRGAVAFRSLW